MTCRKPFQRLENFQKFRWLNNMLTALRQGAAGTSVAGTRYVGFGSDRETIRIGV
jgi:hypothetical protein